MTERADIELKLKQYLYDDLESAPKESQITETVRLAKQHALLREGVGFVGALFWILIASLGLKLWSALREHNQVHVITTQEQGAKTK